MSRPANNFDTSRVWFALAALTLVFAGVVAVYWQGFEALVRVWRTEGTYNHGFLILAVMAVLLWRRRNLFLPGTPLPWLLVPLTAVSAVGWAAVHTDIELVQQLIVPVLLVLTLGVLFGWRSLRQALFPLMFLYFAVPAWEICIPWLQHFTVVVVTHALGWVSIPVHIEGAVVTVPSGVFEIAEGCSGVRQFLVAATVTALYGHLYYRRALTAAVLLAAGFGIALVTNWVRVFAIILIGHATEMQHSLIEDHALFGWILFAVGLIPLFLLAWRLERWDAQRSAPAVQDVGPRQAATGTSRLLALTAPVLLVLFAPVLLARAAPGNASGVSLNVPDAPPNWQRHDTGLLEWRPAFAGADRTASGVYVRGGTRVWLHLYFYARQRSGAELAGGSQHIGDSRRWRSIAEAPVAVDAGPLTEIREARIQGPGGETRLVWYWYRVGGSDVTSRYRVKLMQAFSVFGGREDAALVAAAARCETDCRDARRDLAGFYAETYASLIEELDAAAGRESGS